jgi:DNA-binding CsgD family transcriptional regulator
VVNRLTRIISGSAGLLFTPQQVAGPLALAVPDNISPQVMQRYADHYHKLDVWTQAGVERGLFLTGEVACDEDLLPRSTFLKSAYFREFLRPSGISRICVSVVFGDEDDSVPATVISIYRGLRAKAFDQASKETLRMLVPHLSRALATMYRLRSAECRIAATSEALDRIERGIILFGAAGQVLHTNRSAGAVLDEADGITLASPNRGLQRLFVPDPRRRRAIDGLIDSALSCQPDAATHVSKGVLIPRPSGRLPLFLSLSKLSVNNPYGLGANQVAAIGFLTDAGRQPSLNMDMLRETFGLTPGEIRLVTNLCSGKTIMEIANQLGLSQLTLRDQLKRIFAKTGVNRQANLVRLVLSLSN